MKPRPRCRWVSSKNQKTASRLDLLFFFARDHSSTRPILGMMQNASRSEVWGLRLRSGQAIETNCDIETIGLESDATVSLDFEPSASASPEILSMVVF